MALRISPHSEELYDGISLDPDGRSWIYLAYGPFTTLKDYRSWLITSCLLPSEPPPGDEDSIGDFVRQA